MRTPDPPAIFHWPRKSAVQLGLPLALVVAALLHAPFFVLFDVAYPPPTGFRPARAAVTFVDARTPGGRPFLARVEAEDPALFAASFQDSREEFQPAARQYRASFDMRTIPLAPAPESDPVIAPETGDLPVLIDQAALLAVPAIRIPATRLELEGTLTPDDLRQAPAWDPLPADPVSAPPVRFEVGVDSAGQVRFLFLLDSSGDAELDAAARQLVRSLAFQPAPHPGLRWTTARLSWGHPLRRP